MDWNPDRETFRFLAAHFDVAAAKRCLIAKPHRVGEMPVSAVEALVGSPEGGGAAGYTLRVAVDWDRVQADQSIDLSVPVILAWTRAGSLIPIDGWHRIAKAKLQGVENLPAVKLTKAESKKVWL